MDKENYLDILKNNQLRPNKIKIKEHEPRVLNEVPDYVFEVLHEIFIQTAEIEKIEDEKERDKQILRLAIVAELDASNLYEKMATMTKNKTLQKILKDVSKEEKTHAGEFQYLLEQIDPEHEEELEAGADEVKDLI